LPVVDENGNQLGTLHADGRVLDEAGNEIGALDEEGNVLLYEQQQPEGEQRGSEAVAVQMNVACCSCCHYSTACIPSIKLSRLLMLQLLHVDGVFQAVQAAAGSRPECPWSTAVQVVLQLISPKLPVMIDDCKYFVAHQLSGIPCLLVPCVLHSLLVILFFCRSCAQSCRRGGRAVHEAGSSGMEYAAQQVGWLVRQHQQQASKSSLSAPYRSIQAVDCLSLDLTVTCQQPAQSATHSLAGCSSLLCGGVRCSQEAPRQLEQLVFCASQLCNSCPAFSMAHASNGY